MNRNEQIIRQFFAGYGKESPVHELFAANAVWIEPGKSSLSGRYCGPQAIFELCTDVLVRSGGTFRIIEIVDVIANDRHGLALIIVEGLHQGRAIRTQDTVVFRFEGTHAVEARVFSDDQDEVDSFWS